MSCLNTCVFSWLFSEKWLINIDNRRGWLCVFCSWMCPYINPPQLPPSVCWADMASLLVLCISVLSIAALGSCDLEEKPFVERAGRNFIGRASTSILTVPNGGKFGDWTWIEMCPEGFYASGFSVRVKTQSCSLVSCQEHRGTDSHEDYSVATLLSLTKWLVAASHGITEYRCVLIPWVNPIHIILIRLLH